MALIGMGGSVAIGLGSGGSPVTYCVERWQVDWENDVQDVTDTCSAGYVTRIEGVESATLTFTAFFNQTTPQWNALTPGATIDYDFFVGVTNIRISGLAIISSVSVENPVKNPVRITVTALSTGAISTGSI